MNSGNIFRSFSSSRRQFLKQSAALAAAVGVAPAALSAGAGSANAATGSAYANELWEKTKAELAGMSDIRMDLNLHSWEGYTEEPVLDPFSRQTGANVNPQMLISDPAAVNNLRGGGTSTWDVINLNNSWQRNQLFPEGLIVPLDKDKFAPLYDMNVGGFEWPYHWALDESGEHLLGMLQRYGPAGLAVNTDLVDPQTMESGGYMEMIEGAKGQYGILDYENWVIMHTCIASGFIPFREHTADEMAAFEENIFKLFENAKKVSDDQAALARDMITGEIIGTYPGSVYTVSAARLEGETQLVNVVPAEGPEETKTAERPMGQGGIVWIEVTSLVNNPDPTPPGRGVPYLLPHARGRLQGGGQGAGHAQPGGADGGAGGAEPVLPGRARRRALGRGRQLAGLAGRSLRRLRHQSRLRRDARPLHPGEAQPRRLILGRRRGRYAARADTHAWREHGVRWPQPRPYCNSETS